MGQNLFRSLLQSERQEWGEGFPDCTGMGVIWDVACSLAEELEKQKLSLTLAWRVRTGEREWQGSPQPESDLAAQRDLTNPSWKWDVAAGGREATDSWANQLPQNKLSNSNIPGVKCCLLCCLSTFLFLPLIRHCLLSQLSHVCKWRKLACWAPESLVLIFPSFWMGIWV